MTRIFIYLLCVLSGGFTCVNAKASLTSEADTQTLEKQITTLQAGQTRAESDIHELKENSKSQSCKVDSLKSITSSQKQQIDSLRAECVRLAIVQSVDRDTLNGKLVTTNNAVAGNRSVVENRTLWGIVIVLIVVALSFGTACLLWKRIKRGKSRIEEVSAAQEALQKAQAKIQEESVALDNKFIELAEKQLAVTPRPTSGGKETDHSLILKVADELVRIELNMSRMDATVKGYKQLAKAVQRIKDNFYANGYEIVDMLGKPYNEGMKVVANFVADETLEEGTQIITGITKPQINYNGKMIQAAQITVSQNI